MKHLLTYQDEKSDKFWEVEVKGKEMRVRYGKTGTEGQVSVKQFTSVPEAETAAEKAIAEKVKKGYQNYENTRGSNGTEDIEISIIASISSEQTFDLFDDSPSDKVILKEFKALKFTLDPAPPCDWSYDIQSVKVSLDRKIEPFQELSHYL